MSFQPTTRRNFLKSSTLAASATALRGSRLLGQSTQADAHIDILPAEPIATISPEIYSHFIEQLGGVIYDGVWVGEGSKIRQRERRPQGLHRHDARREGSCAALARRLLCRLLRLARRHRPARSVPARAGFWDQQDPNTYGLHEFMHTCRAIGCKPYLAADLRSLPARDFYQEIEYCNAPAGECSLELRRASAEPNALAAQRAANGDRRSVQR